LLVTLAIIGVLTALLLPALRSAKTKSNGTTCQHNLKQLGLAVHLYADDARDSYPLAIWRPHPTGPVVSFDDYLYPYLGLHLTDAEREANRIPLAKQTKLLLCPEDKIPPPSYAGPGSWRRTYSLSEARMVSGANPFKMIDQGGVGAYYSIAWGPYSPNIFGKGVPVSAVVKPSDTLVLVERPNHMNLAGNDHWAVTRQTAEQTNGLPSAAAALRYHDGRFNYLYADGRVQLQLARETWGATGNPTSWAGAWTIRPDD
jgi:prepilin-type processing-associated H-X9-DG protein